MTSYSELYKEVQPFLHSGEEVLWIGKPVKASMPRTAVFPAAFSVFFMIFAVFWMMSASQSGGMFFLFGIPFFAAGVGLLYSTTLGQRLGLKKSVYAVTETRAIIITKRLFSGTNCKEYIFSTLPGVSLENVKGSVGTIRFEGVNVYYYQYGRFNRKKTVNYQPERELTTAFVMIDDVHSVYHLISERTAK